MKTESEKAIINNLFRERNIKSGLAGVVLLLALMSVNTSVGAAEKAGETSILSEVTQVNGNTVTVLVGTEKKMGPPPDSQSGNGNFKPGNPPAGSKTSPDPMHFLDLTGEKMILNITEETAVKKEISSKIYEGNISDISEKSILLITYTGAGDEKKIISVTVKTPSFGIPQNNFSLNSNEVPLTAVYTADGITSNLIKKKIISKNADQSAVLARNGSRIVISGSEILKSGDSSSEENSNFFALNSGIASTDESSISIVKTVIKTDSEGSNAVFATGKNSKINISDSSIFTSGNSSRGLDATYNGTVNAENVDITTKGAHCAAVATDRGEGTITVKGGRMTTSGEGSPCVYSTGNITVTGAVMKAEGSEAAVIEGKNSITLTDSNLTGYEKNGVMLYQSFSGDADTGTSVFNMKNGSITSMKGAVFYITNTAAEINLANAGLDGRSGILIEASADRWGVSGSNGGKAVLNSRKQILNGKVISDSISSIIMNLKEESTFTGDINSSRKSGRTELNLDESSVWNVTAASHLSVLTDEDEKFSNIRDNGNTVYYSASEKANSWLKGKTYSLQGGGKLIPE